jgi:hypothetical protein
LMVTPGRLELPTCGLGNRRSIHLSYGVLGAAAAGSVYRKDACADSNSGCVYQYNERASRHGPDAIYAVADRF